MARIEPVFSDTLGETENPYQVSQANLTEHEIQTYSTPRIFDFQGRVSLTYYWLLHAPFAVLIPLALLAFFTMGLRQEPIVMLLAGAIILIPAGLLSLSFLMRRARDLGWSPGWCVAGSFVPGIGFLVLAVLAFCPGQKKANKYGSPNKPTSKLTKSLSLTFFALSLIVGFLLAENFQEYGEPILSDIFTQILTRLIK